MLRGGKDPFTPPPPVDTYIAADICNFDTYGNEIFLFGVILYGQVLLYGSKNPILEAVGRWEPLRR